MRRREALYGILFLMPWLLGFLFFVAGPMVASFVLSFSKYNVVSPITFVGVDNYIRAFANDRLFWPSLGRTFYYAVVVVPVGLIGSLLLALLLNQGLKATNLFRTLFFLPSLTPVVALALLWTWILHPELGLMNYLLGMVGIEGPPWLGSKQWAIPSLIIMTLWGSIGGSHMLIFLAGLQNVERDVQEAASIDGANGWQQFWYITIPMISPTIFFNLLLGIIGALKVFTAAWVATQGGPAYATWFYALHIYQNAFQFFDMGYASALSWIFFVIMFLFAYVQFRTSGRWVYYAGEESK